MLIDEEDDSLDVLIELEEDSLDVLILEDEDVEEEELLDVEIDEEDDSLEVLIDEDEDVEDVNLQIAFSKAILVEPDFEVGEDFSEQVWLKDFERREILAIRQNLVSKILEYEKDNVSKKYKEILMNLGRQSLSASCIKVLTRYAEIHFRSIYYLFRR